MATTSPISSAGLQDIMYFALASFIAIDHGRDCRSCSSIVFGSRRRRKEGEVGASESITWFSRHAVTSNRNLDQGSNNRLPRFRLTRYCDGLNSGKRQPYGPRSSEKPRAAGFFLGGTSNGRRPFPLHFQASKRRRSRCNAPHKASDGG